MLPQRTKIYFVITSLLFLMSCNSLQGIQPDDHNYTSTLEEKGNILPFPIEFFKTWPRGQLTYEQYQKSLSTSDFASRGIGFQMRINDEEDLQLLSNEQQVSERVALWLNYELVSNETLQVQRLSETTYEVSWSPLLPSKEPRTVLAEFVIYASHNENAAYTTSFTLNFDDVAGIPTPFWTPVPTLTLNEHAEQVDELLRSRNNCQLPCWWGITPGKTTWDDAYKLIGATSDNIYFTPSIFSQDTRSFFVESLVTLPNLAAPTFIISQNFSVENNLVKLIEISPGNMSLYPLSEILSTYGQPSHTWIKTTSYTYLDPKTFRFELILFYDGIMISYIAEAKPAGENLQACFSNQIYANALALWAPTPNLDYFEASQMSPIFRLANLTPPIYRFVEDATQFDLETFYQNFRDPSGLNCLDTPNELWP